MKKYIGFILLLLLCTTLSAIEYKLSGYVQNLGELPIKNAEVVLLNLDVTCDTDDKGFFKLEGGVSIENHQSVFTPIISNNSITLPAQEKSEIRVVNLKGAQVLSKTYHASSQQTVLLSDLYVGLSEGMYITQIFSGKEVSSYKTIKQDNIALFQKRLQKNASSSIQHSRSMHAIDTLAVIIDDKIKIKMPLTSLIDSAITIGINILPEVYTTKVKDIPDYWQLDNAYGGFNNGGQVFCGPTTVSNSLMWLCDDMGYTKLAKTSSDRKYAQFKMIELLGSDNYMNLGSGGVGPWGVCDGVNKYFKTAGVTFKSMRYEGFRNIQSAWDTGKNKPSMESVKKGLMAKGSVWLNFGWYTYSSSRDTYTRSGGHWMTLVGYGYDGQSKDPNCLIVHDPWTGNTFNNYRKLTKITSGKLAGSTSGLPQNATGYYKYWTGKKWGILDGIVVLQIE